MLSGATLFYYIHGNNIHNFYGLVKKYKQLSDTNILKHYIGTGGTKANHEYPLTLTTSHLQLIFLHEVCDN